MTHHYRGESAASRQEILREIAAERERWREIEQLARDHAALLDWAANIAHATRRRDQALRIYWDYFSEGAIKTARWRGNDHLAEDWWTRYERYQKRVEALLVEWAEMQERPS